MWKTPGLRPQKVPSNVFCTKWFPQNDLLGHPKVNAFLSHGGFNGVNEAAYHGVPVVGFPLFADQFDNIARLQYRVRPQAGPDAPAHRHTNTRTQPASTHARTVHSRVPGGHLGNETHAAKAFTVGFLLFGGRGSGGRRKGGGVCVCVCVCVCVWRFGWSTGLLRCVRRACAPVGGA